ncbi:MAG: putative bifunctional diguanylate cyclase/phosphodiesterase [Candidatus Competibacterales bacterium]
MKALLGFDDDEITPRLAEWHGRIHPDDRERVLKALADYRLGRALHYRCEYRLIGRDGGECWVRDQGQAARDELGEPLRLVGLTLDIGAQKRAELTLQRQAQHDALTLLPNRQHFVDCLRRACRSVAPTPDGSSFAVLFIDLDRFKIVNDSLGHDAGDRLLKMAADRLRRHLATTHLLARLGGDEFAVLVTPCGSADDALTLAGELIDALQAPFTLHNQRFDLSASIGVAMSRQADEPAVLADAAELLRRADLAMYRAKVQGSGQRVLYSAEMSVAASDRVHLEAELRRALGGGQQLQMFFQPIVQLEDGQVVGFEALLRWRHPRLGLLFPKTFLPIAEEAGLLGELGRFGLAKACEAMQQALITGALSPRTVMSVNASGADLCQPDWSQQVAGIVRRTGLPFDRLRIEVTESALAENSAEAPAQLTALKALGVEVAIDDFGTGYSSLERLLDLPVDVLKVDRSFVADIHTNTRRQRLVQAIIDFAHVLGLVVVAEGVEQLAHQRLLRAMGCECGQGYWFAPARPELSSEIGGVGGHAPVAPMDS